MVWGKAASTNTSILDEKRGLNTGKLGVSLHPAAQPSKCPECASQRVWKDGLRYTKNGEVQRWLCRGCGFRFSEPVVVHHENARLKIQPLKALSNQVMCSQVCELLTEDSKNLSKVETRQRQVAGATKATIAEVKGKIVEFAWYLKKQGYSPETIKTYTSNLKRLHKYGADLLDGESVKETIAQQENWNTSTKHTAVTSYMAFTRSHGLKWDPPSYKPQTKLPFIPLESEIDALIASTGKKTSTILQLLKETAMRIGEACRLKWIDVDLEHNTITVNDPEKHGKPRMFKMSNKLAAMLNALPRINNNLLGKTKACDASKTLILQRKRTASKLQNPRINYIHFHTLRHWKATMEYHKTKDILHVKEMLGHRSIDNTLIYTQLISFENDDFHVKVAKTLKEDKELIEAGFEYVTERDGLKIYRKRK